MGKYTEKRDSVESAKENAFIGVYLHLLDDSLSAKAHNKNTRFLRVFLLWLLVEDSNLEPSG